MRALLIINSVAGRRRSRGTLYRAVNALSSAGYETTVYITQRRGDAARYIRENVREGFYDRIVCCGGDGTLNEVLGALTLKHSAVPVGYIPTGTTNDLAHSLHLPSAVEKTTVIAAGGSVRDLDIGVFAGSENGGAMSERSFVYVASFGAFARVSYCTPQWLKNLLGHGAYVFDGVFSLDTVRPRRVEAEYTAADGTKRVVSGNYVYGAVSNSTSVGGVIKYKESEIDFADGLFEVMLISPPRGIRALTHTLRCIKKREFDPGCIECFTASDITFSFSEKTEWTLDGEFGGALDSASIRVEPCAARIVVASAEKKSGDASKANAVL